MIDETVKTYGKLDILVNNAGILGTLKEITEYPEDIYDRLMAVNLKGVFLGMKYAIPYMLKNGKGSIINMASISGIVGTPRMGPYCATKAGIILLTKAVALELARKGIRVNVIVPGTIETAMVEQAVKEALNYYLEPSLKCNQWEE